MIEPVMINIKTPQGWTLQPATGMRLSPHGGYRLEHVRTQKLSVINTFQPQGKRLLCGDRFRPASLHLPWEKAL